MDATGKEPLPPRHPGTPRREACSHAPARLLERIGRGERIDAGERYVSILVGDLRGYSAHTSGSPHAAFARLCRFADQLACAVQERGGEICELDGGGVVALFGGDAALPGMERAAVEAARAICQAARTLPRDPEEERAARLSLGVGVATGRVRVGGIRAGGRTYWSAAGSASDRAVRLHELARRHGAALAVDPWTYQAAGLGAGDAWRPHAGDDGIPEAYLLPWSGR